MGEKVTLAIPFDSDAPFNDLAKSELKSALLEIFGHSNVRMVRTDGAPLTFGVTAPSVRDLTMGGWDTHRKLVAAIRRALPRETETPWADTDPKKILYLDIETHEAEKMWDMAPNEFLRLGQFAWGPKGEVHLTTSRDALLREIARAEGIIAHFGFIFDFLVLFPDEVLDRALAGQLFDTSVFANQAYPAPRIFSMRNGRRVLTDKSPEAVSVWLGLDNLAYQLGQDGKEGDLKALAKKYGGFGLIPTDDTEYTTYAKQDIRSLQGVTSELVAIHPPTEYDWREQTKAAIDAQMTFNGVRIDVDGARERIEELTARKTEILDTLAAEYDFPTTGKMPWRSAKGKAAILAILESYGIVPDDFEPDVWPQLKTGPSLGGQVMLEVTKGTDAEELGETLAELQGQRWLAQTALDHLHSDGLCHPQITGWQRSGRRSVRNPGLTVWGERNPRDKRYIIAKDGHLLLECDLSNADQRIVAALSGDREYAKRFLPGADGHEISGRLMYGNAEYDTDPVGYRKTAKALSHAYAYGAGPRKLAASAKQPLELAEKFVNAMKRAYPGVIRWQNKVRDDAARGFIVNHWGRRVPVDRGNEYTQAPAMHGQSGTTEVMYDGLIRLAKTHRNLLNYLICLVHDALLFDLPEDLALSDQVKTQIRECLESRVNSIDFPVSFGPAAFSWEDARHV